MPVFRIENEQGQWLTDMSINAPNWKPGDKIYRGRDSLEVIDVRPYGDKTALIVKAPVVPSE